VPPCHCLPNARPDGKPHLAHALAVPIVRARNHGRKRTLPVNRADVPRTPATGPAATKSTDTTQNLPNPTQIQRKSPVYIQKSPTQISIHQEIDEANFRSRKKRPQISCHRRRCSSSHLQPHRTPLPAYIPKSRTQISNTDHYPNRSRKKHQNSALSRESKPLLS